MPSFKSIAELKSDILSRCVNAVDAAADDVYDKIDGVLDRFYENDPEYYRRTGKLGDSLSILPAEQFGDSYCSAEVYFDEGALDYKMGEVLLQKPLYGSWYGWAERTGEDVLQAAMLGPSVVRSAGKKINWTNDVRVWDESMEILNNEAVGILKDELKKSGLPIK